MTASVTPHLQGIGSREDICLSQREREEETSELCSVLLNRSEDVGAGGGE